MIGLLEGRVLELQPGEVLLAAGGVGYEVRVPLSAHRILSESEQVRLYVHTHVREDVLALYGFPTRGERDAFRRLLGVAGIGPRIALALLSGLTVEELAAAVEGERWQRLAAVPGIGRRTAERLVVELKGKWRPDAPAAGSIRDDAVSALVNLGYSPRDAEKAVAALVRAERDLDLPELLRRALKELVG